MSLDNGRERKGKQGANVYRSMFLLYCYATSKHDNVDYEEALVLPYSEGRVSCVKMT